LETQTSNRFKRTIAILLAVLFVVSLTANATNATPPSCKGPIPLCRTGYHDACVNGHWKCVSSGPCKGPIPNCRIGYHIACVNGHWQCVQNKPVNCKASAILCRIDYYPVCDHGQWKCKPWPQ
jgi:hypothetical protein